MDTVTPTCLNLGMLLGFSETIVYANSIGIMRMIVWREHIYAEKDASACDTGTVVSHMPIIRNDVVMPEATAE